MPTLTKVKLALALVGVMFFGGGIRNERADWRWAGIGAVAVAWALRFVKPRDRSP